MNLRQKKHRQYNYCFHNINYEYKIKHRQYNYTVDESLL